MRSASRYVTMHAHGGVDMLRAGVEGLAEGSGNAGLAQPTALAVTVLTSDSEAPPHIVPKRVKVALEGGCGGIVCAAADLAEIRQYAPALLKVVPGIRSAGTPKHDQARSSTPAEALSGGADLLVVGRTVTQADDPVGRRGRAHGRARPRPDAAAWIARSPRGAAGIMRYFRAHASASRPHTRAATGRAREGRAGPAGPGRAQGEAQDGLALAARSSSQDAEKDDIVGKMKVLAVLESLPGVGKVKARRTMEKIGISETRRVRGLGVQQRKELLAEFSG